MTTVKPSQLVARGNIFFPGALRKAELEFAVLWIALYLAANGDEWRPVQPRELGEFAKAAVASGDERYSIFSNPLARPDFRGLAERGLATIAEPDNAIDLSAECVELCAKSIGIVP